MFFKRLYEKLQLRIFSSGKNFYHLLLMCLILPGFGANVRAEFIADDVKLIRLTDDGKSRAVSWAFQGDLVSFVREETGTQKQLMIMKSDGTGEEAVTQIGNPFFVQWSWSGDKISYEFSNAADSQSQGGIYIYDVLTKKSQSISSPYPREAIDPDDGPFFSSDDSYVAYKVRPGAARKRQLWVADTQSGKSWRLLADRGQGKEQRWSPFAPQKLSLQIEASGGQFDIAAVSPDGKDLVMLTDIGAQSINADEPRWSPTGEWVAFTSDVDLTQSERLLHREDCWIARPDGSEAKNLTNATSSATENQLGVDEPLWSWDGRWILAEGDRFDNQGNEIPTAYLIDPVNGGYEPILTSYPRKTGEIEFIRSLKWSYDSTKILFATHRFAVKNWGPDRQFENSRWALSIYDCQKKTFEELLVFDEQLDRKMIFGHSDRDWIDDVSWSPDNRSILFTIASVISRDDDIYQPDIYRLDLPERLIDASASQHIGPPIGKVNNAGDVIAPLAAAAASAQITEQSQSPIETLSDTQGDITEIIKPLHMTVSEAIESLPSTYDKYISINTVRNIILFKGPPEALAEMKTDMSMIDTEVPHILVDLMAVELTEEANRNLGLDWAYADRHFALSQPVGRALQNFSQTTNLGGFPAGARDTLVSMAGMGQAFYQGVGDLPREFFLRLNTLVKDGEGTILANPRTVAMSGKESLINIRKTLNYFFNEGFDTSGRPIVKKSDISADTEGRIVPTLLADGKIHLKVEVKVGNFTFTPDVGLPELTTRLSNTEVTVMEGQTLVLGGLRQQEMANTTSKVPILGDIPLIGALFKHEEKEIKHSVLTIFITPHAIIDGQPVPQWPQLDSNKHIIIPIMEDEKSLRTNGTQKHKSNHKTENKQPQPSTIKTELSDEAKIKAWMDKRARR